MVQGTMSNAGKSLVTAGLCRVFNQDGYKVAPFKSQNMALNSFITRNGAEMGRAQVVQAEAANIEPSALMNPILLKPTSDSGSQVIVNGEAIGTMTAAEYFKFKTNLIPDIMKAYGQLSESSDVIVIEGAGSPAEINLKSQDIVNMGMAKMAKAPVLLVADIDRGGVFASIYGTLMLLEEDERAMVKGIIVNKFRGDVSLFEEGRQIIRELTGVPVVGVIPYYKDIHIEEEDSVALEAKASAAVAGKINVAVIRLPRMSNFTDFNALERDGRFHLYYTDKAEEIGKADVIILPGTKSTIADLQAIYANGVAEAVVKAFRKKKKVIGICGGYQMMGVRIEDPGQVEGMQTATDGLGLLPLVTVMQDAKVVCQSHFRFKNYESDCAGYQIHMGTTTPLHAGGRQTTLNTLADGTTDGYRLNADCWGSYMHGILDNPVVLDDLAAGFGVTAGSGFDYRAFKERQYDLLAGQVRKAVDLDYIYSTLFL